MSFIRTPVVNAEQIGALRTLLRLDFTYGVRQLLGAGMSESLTCLGILNLTESLQQAEQPLVVVSALMQHRMLPTATVPLDSTRYELFSRLLDAPLALERFPGITQDNFEAFLLPLKTQVEALKVIFQNAPYVDEDSIRKNVATTSALPNTELN